jgi:predicted dehydrogenase
VGDFLAHRGHGCLGRGFACGDRDAWWPQGHTIGWEHTFTHQIRDFLLAGDGGTPPSPSFEDGLKIQRILHAVEESANNESSFTIVNH